MEKYASLDDLQEHVMNLIDEKRQGPVVISIEGTWTEEMNKALNRLQHEQEYFWTAKTANQVNTLVTKFPNELLHMIKLQLRKLYPKFVPVSSFSTRNDIFKLTYSLYQEQSVRMIMVILHHTEITDIDIIKNIHSRIHLLRQK